MSDSHSQVIVYRPVRGKLEVRIPYRVDNHGFFTKLGARPEWDAPRRRWLIARGKFRALVEALAREFPWWGVTVIIDGKEKEQCDTRCQSAKGYDCTCSCAGTNHGACAQDEWLLVSDTTLVRYGPVVRSTRTYKMEGMVMA